MEDLENLIIQYKTKGVIVDANLLLVYIVGLHNPRRLSGFKRTSNFNEASYGFLSEIIGQFKAIITTPNILTEVCNLLGILGEPERS